MSPEIAIPEAPKGSIPLGTLRWFIMIFVALAGVWAANEAKIAKTETRIDGFEKRLDRFEDSVISRLDAIYAEMRERR